jgi:RNA polymerase sigma-70 factor (ECF subfamily)
MAGRWRGSGTDRSASRFARAREDPAAFAEVYVEYHRPVLRFFARSTLDPETAFDLMAETFAELFTVMGTFRGETEEEGQAWMWAVARHQLYGWYRKGTVERRSLERLGVPVATLGPLEYERIEELADLQRVRPQLERALARLSGEQQQALQLRVIEHRSYDEIAALCGVSAGVVRARVSRALRQLGRWLGEDPSVVRAAQELNA